MATSIHEAALMLALRLDAERPPLKIYGEHPRLARLTRTLNLITLMVTFLGPLIFFWDWQAIIVSLILSTCYTLPMLLIASLVLQFGFVIGFYLDIAWTLAAWYLGYRGVLAMCELMGRCWGAWG